MFGNNPTVPVRAPEFIGGSSVWLNSPKLTMASLKGRLVLVDFWEYTCVNCIRTLPYVKQWHERYHDLGLVVVGIHTPEFEFAKSARNVAQAVKRFGITYPVLIDSDYANWRAYANSYWPRKYLIDSTGRIVYDHAGEGGYLKTESIIQGLLRKLHPGVKLPALMSPTRDSDKEGAVCYPTSPELYCGMRGAQNGQFMQTSSWRRGETVSFGALPSQLPRNQVVLQGKWQCQEECLRHGYKSVGLPDAIAVRYYAKEANAVLKSSTGAPLIVYVTQDNRAVRKQDAGDDIQYDAQGHSYLALNQPRMYHLTSNAKYGEHILTMSSDADGFEVYSYTFSSCVVE